jgi:predicted transcriptional regulator
LDNDLNAETPDPLIELTSDIVSAYVTKNSTSAGEVSTLIARVHAALQGLGAPPTEPVQELKPAVPIRRSVTPDHIVCLDDGKKFRSLKRHLATLGMTPDQYRAKWGLPADYPMVAPNYSATRSQLAKTIGLGRNGKSAPAKCRGRKSA